MSFAFMRNPFFPSRYHYRYIGVSYCTRENELALTHNISRMCDNPVSISSVFAIPIREASLLH